jgi:hypothetical protein
MSGRCKTRLALSKIGKKILNVIIAPSLKMTIDKSLNMNLAFRFAVQSDAEVLVDIHIAAMRESLERIGRFDPQRARERFLASFERGN